MKIEVGDRITYKFDDVTRIEIATDIQNIKNVEEAIERGKNYKIIKIERPNWEVVEEKKELLTDEEREFLKEMTKYYQNIIVEFYETAMLIKDGEKLINCPDYPKNMKFKGVERCIEYTPKELRIGGINENRNKWQ